MKPNIDTSSYFYSWLVVENYNKYKFQVEIDITNKINQPTGHLFLQSKHKLSVQLCNNAILAVPWDTQHHQNSNFQNTIYQFSNTIYFPKVCCSKNTTWSRNMTFLKMSFNYPAIFLQILTKGLAKCCNETVISHLMVHCFPKKVEKLRDFLKELWWLDKVPKHEAPKQGGTRG